MNWYKVATEGRAVSVTPAGFGAMMRKERIALARNPSISPETQRLFFTEEYAEKDWILWHLAGNPSITLETQRLFFAGRYGRKDEALRRLAWNPSITPEMQPLFFTESYENKGWVLESLVRNKSFLRGDFTLEALLLIRKVARGTVRLKVLKKRLEQIAGAS